MRSCTEFHRARGSLLPGSAPECLRWLFVDRKRPWPPKIEKLAEVEIYAPELKRLGAKLLFSHSLHGVVRAVERRGELTRGGRFGSVEQALAFFESDAPAEQGELFAVCTHGSRDTCCGTFGPAVAAALAGAGAEVLEVSHPGGHRFAPTILAFPEFRCYGSLTAADVPVFLERQRTGSFQPRHYRGAMYLSKRGQVAEAAVWATVPTFGASRVLEEEPARVRLQSMEGPIWQAQLEELVFRGFQSCGDEDEELRELRATSLSLEE